MNIEVISYNEKAMPTQWKSLLEKSGLDIEGKIDSTVLVWDENELIATGSREGNLLKLIAVDDSHRGEDLAASVLTALRKDAFDAGFRRLFLYTKPQNKELFSQLFFYPVAKTDKVLLMEDRKNGVNDFLSSLSTEQKSGKIGAVVMNCNPFTLGHKYLTETAAAECDYLYIFVLSEEKSYFSFADRFEMVKRATQHLPNVFVYPTGEYLISSATFPTYFIKEKENVGEIQCRLDIEIFAKYFAKHFNISMRYVGSEPLCAVTEKYNQALFRYLPEYNIECKKIERFEKNGAPVSASLVREKIKSGEAFAIEQLVPKTTLEYLKEKKFI